jgi:O-methyltransferase
MAQTYYFRHSYFDMLKIVKFLKDFLLFFPITRIAQPLAKGFHFIYYFNLLNIWIHRHKSQLLYCDFYSPIRRYEKRYQLYDFVAEHFGLSGKRIIYLEFGVASAASFKWWLERNKHPESFFAGFDTFEGLPEQWGNFFEKGSMSFQLPDLTDKRATFRKGLFQDTLTSFTQEKSDLLLLEDLTRVIHLDADLYSSTAFTLSQLYPYLKKGDLIFFDEFNVPLHEFKAYHEFVTNFYIRLRPVASVNNFYQAAFVVE